MRIGVDATALYGRYGGVEYSLWNLLYALRAIDIDNRYTIYVPSDGPPEELTRQFPDTWKWVRLRFAGGDKAKRIAWQQMDLPWRLRADGCDILHCPTYVAPAIHPRLNRMSPKFVPLVLTVYDLIALDEPQFATPLNRLHYRAMLGRSIQSAQRVIVPSEAVRAAILRRFPAAKVRIRVVPLGLEPVFFEEPSPATLAEVTHRYSLPPRFLLFAGNFEPKKNLATVLEALDKTPEAPPLVVAGGARAWHDVKRGARVRPIGYVSRRDMPALYNLCTAFLFPSLAEGFGLPVIEALAGGAPVITSQHVPLPGLHDVALLCDPRSSDSLAAQLRHLLQDEALQNRLKLAGKEYATPYTWRVTAEKTLEIYRSLVSGK